MPICPECGVDIDHLHYYAYELYKADFWVFDGTNSEYNEWESCGHTKGDPDYECPECSATLFHSEDEAKRFLEGTHEINEEIQDRGIQPPIGI